LAFEISQIIHDFAIIRSLLIVYRLFQSKLNSHWW